MREFPSQLPETVFHSLQMPPFYRAGVFGIHLANVASELHGKLLNQWKKSCKVIKFIRVAA
jgi:hypothetical protein